MHAGGIPQVDAREADRRRREDDPPPLMIDVREPDEFAEFRAEGVVSLPLSTFALRYAELPRDRPLLMICKSGSRSLAATAHLLRNGWTDVTNVTGGSDAWVAAGLPYRTGTPEPGEGDLPTG